MVDNRDTGVRFDRDLACLQAPPLDNVLLSTYLGWTLVLARFNSLFCSEHAPLVVRYL